jgi:hypothetical protein
MSEPFEVRWRDLGCPTLPGLYSAEGKSVRVRQCHIDAAGGNPMAVFVAVNLSGDAQPRYVLDRVSTDSTALADAKMHNALRRGNSL